MVFLDGERLTVAQVQSVAQGGEEVGLSPEAVRKMLRSREVVERLATGDQPVYAVNTGVGRLADIRIPPDELEQLQRNVVRSHCCGIGEPLARGEVRAMMLIRANVLAKGFSGIRPVVAQRLCDLLNRGVTPVVPSRGSVGASGDLAPLAHMAIVLIGEGDAEFGGETLPGGEAMRRAGIETIVLQAKEGISLLNGTQAMLSLGCLELLAAELLADTADVICAMTTDAQRGTPRAFHESIQRVRPHPGQARSAAHLVTLLEDSGIRASHLGCGRVQDAYSLRCAPQVHGAVRDTLDEARRVFEIELNSATDNPLVIGGEILSGGNFHGEPLAFHLDYLAIALTALSSISERRIDRLVNPYLNEGLPPFLAEHPGLESGLMMAQVTAAALVAENRVLAAPASVESITTSGNKEDFVSMGMTSALKLQQVVRNARRVLAIEAIAAARALDFLLPLKTSPALAAASATIPRLVGDQPVSAAMVRADALIAGGALTKAAGLPGR